MINFPKIYHTAIQASIMASEKIMDVYSGEINVTIKPDGSPVTQADLLSSEIIASHLAPTRIPITGEERDENNYSARLLWDSHWCVDPLDGTKMFILKNDEFSVNIAHVKGSIPVFGLIASPVQRKIIVGGKGLGVYTFNFEEAEHLNQWKKIEAPSARNSPIIVACSRLFREKNNSFIEILKSEFGDVNYLKMGSALKFIELAEGNADIYVRFGPTMEWDIASGQAILEELSGEVNDIETQRPLVYNKKTLFNPAFIAKTKAVL